MFNIFRRKSFGQLVKAQAQEKLPGFVVSTGLGLLGIGIRMVAVEVVKKATEKKPHQQPQQP